MRLEFTVNILLPSEVMIDSDFFLFEATIHIATGALRARLPVKVWAPALPLTLRLERSISRPIRMGRLGAPLVDPSNLCRRQFSASRLEAWASFRANGTAAFQVDVTDVVRGRLEISDSTVAELGTAANHTVVVGLGGGVTNIGFDVAALGTTEFEVDADSYVFIDDFTVDSESPPHTARHFAVSLAPLDPDRRPNLGLAHPCYLLARRLKSNIVAPQSSPGRPLRSMHPTCPRRPPREPGGY